MELDLSSASKASRGGFVSVDYFVLLHLPFLSLLLHGFVDSC